MTIQQQAQALTQAGYKVLPVHNHKKNSLEHNWPNRTFKPDPSMTGLCIQTGVPVQPNLYPLVIDVDVFNSDKRDEILNEIIFFLNADSITNSTGIYTEETCSGGAHIILLADFLDNKKNLQFKVSEQNCNARRKDMIEVFFGSPRQVMVAPSSALNKQAVIGQYKRTSQVSLADTNDLMVLDVSRYIDLIKMLTDTSHDYRSRSFNHQHQTDEAHREEIRSQYRRLKQAGYQCGPMYNGNKHSQITNYAEVQDSDFDSESLTGIRLKLGKQADGTYLCVYDYDKLAEEQAEIILNDILSDPNAPDVYVEKSVSNGFHVIFKTDTSPDIKSKRLIPGSGEIELLHTDKQSVNLAPTVSFVNQWETPKEPVYGRSEVIKRDILNLPLIPVDIVKAKINAYSQKHKSEPGNSGSVISNISQALELIHQYAPHAEVSRTIKLAFPMPEKLLNFLKIKDYIVCPDKQYIRFMSMMCDDGDNPDAILYFNNNDPDESKLFGYSVQDFHNAGEVLSFAVYLAQADANKFKELIQHIGLSDATETGPIKMTYTSEPVIVECEKYPDPDEVLNHLQSLQMNNPNSKQLKVVITGPTGSGKTEMFYRLAESNKLKMIMAMSYTSQVLQGKEKHTTPGVLEGMCEEDHQIPAGSVFMTYDKSGIILKKRNLKDYTLVIDEAHNLVNHSNFRSKALNNLKLLQDRCKIIILMTATPEYINYSEVDLLIQIKPKNLTQKEAQLVQYNENKLTKLVNFIVDNHLSGTISVVYIGSVLTIQKLEKLIQVKYRDIEIHTLYADVKDTSQVYENIAMNECLSGNGIFENGGILLSTNLIVDGININDHNIMNIYIMDFWSNTDLIQFPSRFRNGFMNYYIFTSGNSPEYSSPNHSRQQLANIFYKVAEIYQRTYKKINRLLNVSVANLYDNNKKAQINLYERYEFLDQSGNIDELLIMHKIQKVQTRRMNWNYDLLKEYIQNDNYKFTVQRFTKILQTESSFTLDDIETGLKEYGDETEKITDQLKTLLSDDKYMSIRKEMLSDYLKLNAGKFPGLADPKHIITNKYRKYIQKYECKMILERYCIGLALGCRNPVDLTDKSIKDRHIESIRKTLANIKSETNGSDMKKDDKYLRYNILKALIGELEQSTDNSVFLTIEDIRNFIGSVNKKKNIIIYNENKHKDVVKDLMVIYDITTKYRKIDGKNQFGYCIGREWKINDIMGFDFS